MIKHLGIDPSPFGPGRGNHQWHPESESDGAILCSVCYIFFGGMHPGCYCPISTSVSEGGYERRNVIKIPVVFIVGKDKDGLFPDFGISGEYVERFGHVPGAVPGRTGMI